MPIAQALQLCPHAILVPVRMARYAEVSRTVIDVLRSYSPRVEKASVDEAYLDATGWNGSLALWKTWPGASNAK